MKNILFVDDEPKVLQGLQRMLRSMRYRSRSQAPAWERDCLRSSGFELKKE